MVAVENGWNLRCEIWYRILLMSPIGVICAMIYVDFFSEALVVYMFFAQFLCTFISFVFRDRGRSTLKRAISSDGIHIILTSQYKEERWLLERLIDSVRANKPTWPVYFVVAAERGSNLVLENWNIPEKYSDLNIHIAVHEKGIPGERPGLGSNLHNAINYINKNLPIDASKVILTKLDGNCIVSNTLLNQIESSWRVGDENVVFQLQLEELDSKTEEFTRIPFLLKYGFTGVYPRYVPYANMTSSGNLGLASSFCLPLQLVNTYGNWDPWLIQEDNLTWYRAVVGARGFPRFKFIHSRVYNAPAVSFYDQFKQFERSVGGSIIARAVLYSNSRTWCSLRIFYILNSLLLSTTISWAPIYNVAFIIQQVLGTIIDWRIWITLLVIQSATISISGLQHIEALAPKSLTESIGFFIMFIILQPPITLGMTCFRFYIYIRGWLTYESQASYHTTGTVTKQ